ncbi:MAG TPA: glycosyltransferase [candidate division WOR-3 bacterium]|uniref:Glycosyltransferase n=1 Tax=candidate division WOR-3 bacterium TaxID=2052148 RepID=A0A7C0XBY0_UNCW3|nr:glycosyltransferase [candidate division WOR-3 bacterium]
MISLICAGGKFLPSGAIDPGKIEIFTRQRANFSNVNVIEVEEDVPFIMEAARKARGEYLLFLLGPARFMEGFERIFSDAMERPYPVLVFSDHIEGGTPRRLYDYRGDITERFPMGYVLGVKKSVLLELGLRPEFKRAYLYDFRLRLEERGGKIIRLREPLYEVPLSGGSGGLLASFSYLNYPPELEREVEKAFKDMLKRRGAFLSGGIRKVIDGDGEVPISVIIPVRNRARFIGKALDSLMRQTFVDFEVVITDTGSTDGTKEIIAEYAEKDRRIRPIFVEGGTLAEALNLCVRYSRGRYVAQLDSDDEYTPDALEVAFGAMEKHPEAALGVSYYEVIDEEGGLIEELGVVRHLEFDRNNILRTEGAGALRIWRRSVLLKLGLFDERNFPDFGEDYDMVLKAVESHDLVRIHRVLYRYRKHGGSSDITTEEERKINLKTLARKAAMERRKLINRAGLIARGLPAS